MTEMREAGKMAHQQSNNASEQAKKKKYNPTDSLPKDKQFGQPNGNPRNNGGVPKRFLEIRKEIAPAIEATQ